MKLLQSFVRQELLEASGHALEPVLNNIIQHGKSGTTLNAYEVFVIGNLSWFFSAGYTSTNNQLDGIVNLDSTATTTETTEYIRSLSANEIEELCVEFLTLIAIGNKASLEPKTDAIEWINFVLRKQD